VRVRVVSKHAPNPNLIWSAGAEAVPRI
jgi:hypothetical protein